MPLISLKIVLILDKLRRRPEIGIVKPQKYLVMQVGQNAKNENPIDGLMKEGGE